MLSIVFEFAPTMFRVLGKPPSQNVIWGGQAGREQLVEVLDRRCRAKPCSQSLFCDSP